MSQKEIPIRQHSDSSKPRLVFHGKKSGTESLKKDFTEVVGFVAKSKNVLVIK